MSEQVVKPFSLVPQPALADRTVVASPVSEQKTAWAERNITVVRENP
jgi:hypothetical protein